MKNWFAVALFALGLMSVGHAQTVKMKMGSPVGPADVGTQRLQAIAADIKTRTGGKLDIEVVAIETIGFKNADSLRVLKQNVLDAMWVIPYYLSRDLPIMGVMAPHGVLLELEDNIKLLEVQRKIADEIYVKAGIVPAAGFFIGDGDLRDLVIVSKKPITSLEDLRKLKVRHFTRDGVQSFNSLGIPTQMVPSSELYLALKTGVVDAAVYGNSYIKSQSIYETTCCVTYMAPFTAAYPATLGFTPAAWAKLDDSMKKAVKDAADVENTRAMAAWRAGKGEVEARQFLESKGLKYNAPMPIADRRQLQEALIKVWRAEAEKLGPEAMRYFEQITAALK